MPRVVAVGEHRRVPVVSLASLLAEAPMWDLVHVDIQGSEVEVLAAAGAPLTTSVRRLCIGTDGRDAEAALFALLPGLGFRLEAEEASTFRVPSYAPDLVRDGTQYWNARAAA